MIVTWLLLYCRFIDKQLLPQWKCKVTVQRELCLNLICTVLRGLNYLSESGPTLLCTAIILNILYMCICIQLLWKQGKPSGPFQILNVSNAKKKKQYWFGPAASDLLRPQADFFRGSNFQLHKIDLLFL